MIKFTETPDGYIFAKDDQTLAIGVYEAGAFQLLHTNNLLSFSNAMAAFVYLNSVYEPREAKEATLDLFTKPARAIDNMSKYTDNAILSNMPKEVFHANLPN